MDEDASTSALVPSKEPLVLGCQLLSSVVLRLGQDGLINFDYDSRASYLHALFDELLKTDSSENVVLVYDSVVADCCPIFFAHIKLNLFDRMGLAAPVVTKLENLNNFYDHKSSSRLYLFE